jgi:hypothetical protein
MTRKEAFVLTFAMLYTIATPLAAVSAMGAALSGFDPGTTPASDATLLFWGTLSKALLFPLVFLFDSRGPLSYLLIFGNGIIWGSVLVGLSTLAQRHWPRRSHIGGGPQYFE